MNRAFQILDHLNMEHGQSSIWGLENSLGKYLGLDVINDQNSSLHSKWIELDNTSSRAGQVAAQNGLKHEETRLRQRREEGA